MMRLVIILLFTILFMPIKVNSQIETNEITRKELIDISSFHDTISNFYYYLNGNVKFKEVYCLADASKEDHVFSYTLYIKEEIYKRNGLIKEELFYDHGVLLKAIEYDNKGNLDYQYIYKYEGLDDIIVNLGAEYLSSKQSSTYTYISYYKGKIILKGYFLNEKKHGVWEYYNNRSGILTKKITWEDGKKITKEKISK